uniref:40S ribosomal protein S30 n=1 Tax=Trichuris muris TaxID=70415 RepID=A0A5S6R2X2_TRIMR
MQLFVRGLKATHSIKLSDVSSVAALMEKLQILEGVPPDDQLLSYNGKPVRGESLADLGLTDNCTIDLSCRLLGGKVHGSLARAGKVKGQTPKVEKKEKRKQKTGRAKRRMQYTRRFVNAVPTGPGRRRGPNANS